ncbi:MAG: DUF374 domain-containing protein [Acidobacteria bacterium]|nr:MAG: DUF374 domain-containing protein [Acidobacteriota bacterium]
MAAAIQSLSLMSTGSPSLQARFKRSRRRLLEWLAIHVFGGFVLRLLVSTWRLDSVNLEPVAEAMAAGQRFILAFWHNRQIGFIKIQQRYRVPVKVMVSRHGDGEIIARIVAKHGIGSVRGSSTRGGSAALKELVEATAEGHVAITPDGPVGPRYQLKQGAVLLASRSGLPVICISWSTDRAWCFRSWDRFLLPKPFARLRADADGPIEVPPGLDADGTEKTRRELEQRMKKLTAKLDGEVGRQIDPALH